MSDNHGSQAERPPVTTTNGGISAASGEHSLALVLTNRSRQRIIV
jgi:hypothetical protein